MDVDVNVGLIPLFVWMLYGVVEVFRERVDEGVEAIRVRFITVVSNAVVDVVSVGVRRVVSKAMVSTSVTRISARTTTRGEPMVPPLSWE